MLCRISCLLAVLLFVPVLHAQEEVQVKVLLEQDQYLVKESLKVGIIVVNHSGRTLELTKGDWLSLSVMDSKDFAVRQIGPVPVAEDISIESSFQATQWLDIGGTFDFRENSRYTVRARVDVQAWARSYYSEAKEFEMIRGASIWQQKFGVPEKNPGDPPEIRNYILQQALYLAQPQLYLRITDESGETVHFVEHLAPMIQVSRPTAQVDTLSRLHVFTQVSMKDFLHIIIDPDGKMQQRHTYVIAGFRPSLKVSPSGGVFVAGGVREQRRSDIPTPKMFLASASDRKIDEEVGSGPANPEPAPPIQDPIKRAQQEVEQQTLDEYVTQTDSTPKE